MAYESIKSRLDWAERHIINLEMGIEAFLHDRPYETTSNIETDSCGDIVVEVEIRMLREIPRELAFLAADAIHNMRAVIDNAIWHIGQSCGASAELAFPIAECRVNFPLDPNYQRRNPQIPKDLMKLPETVRTIIEDVQPYNRSYGDSPEYSPLLILNRLWNSDKHRAPILTATVGKTSFKAPVPVFDGMAQLEGFAKRLDNNTVRMSHTFPKGTLSPDTNLETDVSLKIVINNRRPGGGYFPVVSGLNAPEFLYLIHRFITEDIVEKLKPFF